MLRTLRSTRRLLATSASPPAPAAAAIASLYRRGTGRRGVGPGQPRVVALVSGGGGHLFSWMLSQAGASTLLIEGRVPYEKSSTDAFLREHGRSGEDIGFCSEDMAAELAAAARDRALMLTPRLENWPDCIGVALTATIVSHYTRRGDYRAHAASCHGAERTCEVFTHKMVKGHRERPGEDEACALLALRALTSAAGLAEHAEALSTYGVRLEDSPARTNAVGDAAAGTESVPVARTLAPPSAAAAALASSLEEQGAHVLIPPGQASPDASPSLVPLPLAGALPSGTLVVPWDDELGGSSGAMAAAVEALSALGLEGDGGDGAWSLPPAPVLLEAPHRDHAAAYLAEAHTPAASAPRALRNWAVLRPADTADALSASAAVASPEAAPHTHRALSGALPPGSHVLLSSAAAHSMVAAILVDWESGDGSARLAAAAARGTRFLVARPISHGASELESAAKEAVSEDLPPSLRQAFVFVSDRHFEGTLDALSDGSPSTDGVGGHYSGGWWNGQPHGLGVIQWSNGISFEGRWRHGEYEGWGLKAYSKGGGYAGMWRRGKRQGWGTSYYDGKFGYEFWNGPFEQDKPHGRGTMRLRDPAAVPGNEEGVEEVAFEFEHGQPVGVVAS